MYLETNQIVFSPSDLAQFLDSPFASWMDHLAITNPELLPSTDENNELLSVLHDLGNQHESEVLATFEAKGLTIANLSKRTNSHQATVEAMKMG